MKELQIDMNEPIPDLDEDDDFVAMLNLLSEEELQELLDLLPGNAAPQ